MVDMTEHLNILAKKECQIQEEVVEVADGMELLVVI